MMWIVPRHPYFADLTVPSDTELADALGSAVVSRSELQSWPLAATEKIDLHDGRRFVCKTQLPPTVEAQFYATARSPLLAPCQDLGMFGTSHALVIDWVDGSPLTAADVDQYRRRAEATVNQIAAIDGSPPVHLDLSTATHLHAAAQDTTERLRRVVEAGGFPWLALEDLAAVDAWAVTEPTVAAATTNPGTVHADLSREEVFLTAEDQLRVVDWQRPVRGPREIDLVSLLRSGGIDPTRQVERPYVQLEAFVLLHWAALCAAELFPGASTETYETWATGALATLTTAA